MIKVLSGKVALMARVDAYRTGTESDAQGRRVLGVDCQAGQVARAGESTHQESAARA